jgi:hypothetical protein
MCLNPRSFFLLAYHNIFVESMGLSCTTQVHQIVEARRCLCKYLSSVLVFSEELYDISLCLVFLLFIFSFLFFAGVFLFFLFFLFLFRELILCTEDPYFSVEAEEKSVSKMSHLIGVEDDLCTFFVSEGYIARNQVLLDRYSSDYLFTLIPYEDTHLPDSLHSLSKVMLIW